MRRESSQPLILVLVGILHGASLLAEDDPIPPDRAWLGSYLQEIGEQVVAARGLERFEVLSLAAGDGATLYAGTPGGLVRGSGDSFELVAAGPPGPVRLVAVRGEEVLLTSGGALHRWNAASGAQRIAALPDDLARPASLRALVAGPGGTVFLAGAAGLFRLDGSRFAPEETLHTFLGRDREVRGVAVGPGDELSAAAAAGLFLHRAGAWEELTPAEGLRAWAVRDARAVAFDAAGRLWFASPQGIGCRDATGGAWRLFTGLEGLPFNDFTCVAAHADGSVWLGTTRGAIRFDGTSWAYRQGRRWLPADRVAAIALPRDGSVCLGTEAGIGRLERVPYTLARKARDIEADIDRRHRRTPYGYVLEVSLDDPRDLSRWRQHDSDNDGLWTSMYGAGECFAYAATRDPAAKRRARAAFWALRFLGTVTQGGEHPAPPGYVARTILPAAGPDPNAGRLEQDREEQATGDKLWKVIDPRWPRSADGKWYWKCDTSSDELDGHYFFHALYFDLVAESEPEKDEVRRVVASITDHLVEHGFNLVDHDGKPTRWGRFSPAELNQDPEWWEERGLNSLSMLSYLKVAEHMTGGAKYAAAARELIEKHGYAQNLHVPKIHWGPGSGNHSDDEMAFMGFYNLVRLEKDPGLRALYAGAFHRSWRLERPELNPFFNFLYAAACTGLKHADAWRTVDLTPAGPWLEESIDTLRRFAVDRRSWRLENSHRLDIARLDDPTGRRGPRPGGRRRDGRVLPIDERHVNHWNNDPYVLDQGGDGRELASGASFLLPYYLGLYLGYVKEDPTRAARVPPRPPTMLGRSGERFTLDGRPTFLAGASYYGGLGAGLETISRDLDDLQAHGLNWIRVWATWAAFGEDVSAVTADGEPRPAQLEKLRWLVGECDERGMIVDVTLSRGNGATGPGRLATPEAHRRAVETIVGALRDRRNWYLDLANERNIRDARHASDAELKSLRERVRELVPDLLVTASHGGDIDADDVRDYLVEARLDFLTPHRPRGAGSPGETAADARRLREAMEKLGAVVPVHYQEPFRRGYARDWEPAAADFIADLRGALEGGAAGWCFHNGSTRGAADGQPRRSFDLRERRLIEQLDAEELKALQAIGELLRALSRAR